MFEQNKLADIKIKTSDGQEINANKVFLSRSPVFDAMLNRHDTKEAQEGVIEIQDIDHEVLVEMVRYMYTDEIPKLKEMAANLLVAANKYDLPGLFRVCEDFLIRNITAENFGEILAIVGTYNVTQLKKLVVKFVLENFEKVLSSEEWKNLKENNLALAVEILEARALP